MAREPYHHSHELHIACPDQIKEPVIYPYLNMPELLKIVLCGTQGIS